ncbi:MAG: hypothetical protein WC812_03510 [Candidatus Pacearchaeota archaeon]|jgi:hypothetical protein
MKKPHEIVYFGKSLDKGRLSETEFFIYHTIENSEVEIKPYIVDSVDVSSLENYLKGACFGKTVNHFELINGVPEVFKGRFENFLLKEYELESLKGDICLKKDLSKFLRKNI